MYGLRCPVSRAISVLWCQFNARLGIVDTAITDVVIDGMKTLRHLV
jgi:hypothetical protein